MVIHFDCVDQKVAKSTQFPPKTLSCDCFEGKISGASASHVIGFREREMYYLAKHVCLRFYSLQKDKYRLRMSVPHKEIVFLSINACWCLKEFKTNMMLVYTDKVGCYISSE